MAAPKAEPKSARKQQNEAMALKIFEDMVEEMKAAGTLSGMAQNRPWPPQAVGAGAPTGYAPVMPVAPVAAPLPAGPSAPAPPLAPSYTASSSTGATTSTSTSAPTTTRKRKQPAATTSLDEDIAAYKQDLSHIDTHRMPIDQNCNQVRRRINQVLDSGIFKKGEFCNAIGSSGNALNRFLGQSGPTQGSQSEAYENAWSWFKQRELAGLKMPDVKKRQKAEAAKKAKTTTTTTTGTGTGSRKAGAAASASEAAPPDLSTIHLPGEEADAVPVFDSADEVRKKINAHLKTPGLTQARFCRDLYAQLRAPACKGIQTKQLADFRGKRGPLAGCTSSVFYAAYVFFEKMRLARGKPKSAHRLEMEEAHPGGLDRTNDGRHG